MVSVPEKLCVPIPDGVDFESASFVALGGIALESMRMAQIELGSRVVVIGLGLLGQIIVQVLNAAGTHVFGVDLDDKKMEPKDVYFNCEEKELGLWQQGWLD